MSWDLALPTDLFKHYMILLTKPAQRPALKDGEWKVISKIFHQYP